MAKNTASNAFRKVDVDQFSEDNFRDEDAQQQQQQAGGVADSGQIGAWLQQGKNVDALKAVLSQAPIGNKNQQEKDEALQLVMRVLLSVKQQTQVEAAVKQLDNDQRDVLMKYVYRGFESPSEGSSAHLLLWHEKLFEEAGLGSIVRVLTDRKKV